MIIELIEMYLNNDKQKLLLNKSHRNSRRMATPSPSPSITKLQLQQYDNFLIPHVQLKSICPCDGTCPRCIAAENTGGIPPFQTKLKVSPPDDPLEREADKIAEQIVDMNYDYATTMNNENTDEENINRKCSMCEVEDDHDREQQIQIKRNVGVSNETKSKINNVISDGGQPLDIQIREFMESKFGENFSNVKIHTNKKATEAARAVGALAFTVGQNIVFGQKDYSPWTNEGRKLLAHELVHVVHQSQSSERTMVQRQPASPTTSTAKKQYDMLVANKRFDDAINLVMSTYNFSRENLEQIWYDANFKDDNARTYGSWTNSKVRVGPKAFENGFESFVHIIRHELEHVRQRARKMKSHDLREFLAESVEILSVGLPEEDIKGFILDAEQAIKHWDLLSDVEKRDNWSQFITVRDKVRERYKNGCTPYCKSFKSVMDRFDTVTAPMPTVP